MNRKFARKLLECAGWTAIGALPAEQHVVILEAPHTSIWDFVVGYIYYESVGGHLRTMVKKELFVWPLAPVLKWLGCFPIDRKSPSSTILSIVHEMESNKSEKYHMVMCPEGTRKPVSRWKPGFHIIARGADVPVYLALIDYGRKEVGIFGRFELTSNMREDIARLQKTYEEMGITALHPEGYLTR